jgi:hypothetical protein
LVKEPPACVQGSPHLPEIRVGLRRLLRDVRVADGELEIEVVYVQPTPVRAPA